MRLMRPLSAAACCALAVLIPAAAAALAECDATSLVQVDARAGPAEPEAQLRADEAPKVESDFADSKAVKLNDGSGHLRTKMGTLEFMAKLLRELSAAPWGGDRAPIDFSPLMEEPRIANGLLFGDLTKAIIELAHEQKAPSTNEVRTTDMMNGHSLLVNNLAVVLVLTCIAVVPWIGHKIDCSEKADGEHQLQAPRRFSYRIGLLLLASYLIWIPAMFSADFSFNIAFIVPVTGQRVGITRDEHHDHIPGPIHESTRTLIHLLWSTRAHTGAVLIAIYAFVVPAVKLMLLSVGEFFRFSDQVHLRKLSRNCILLMQFISKWAAPDMFAYVLVYYLIRELQNLPISTLAMFDVGFTCYGVFSLTCAISSLGIPLPQIAGSDLEEAKPPWVKRMLEGSSGASDNRRRLFKLVCFLASVWLCLFLAGLIVPCFALHLDAELLKDHVPDSMKQVLGMIKLNRIIKPQDVSLCEAMWAMLYWFVTDKDLNLLLAFVMISVFAVALTALNMANLIRTAWQLSQEAPAGRHPCPAVHKSEILKHVSMLDVLIMGVIVATCAAGIYRENGVIIYTCHGICVLIAAEVMHYLTYFVVRSVAEYEIKVAEAHAKIISYADGEKGSKRVVN